MPTYHYFPKRRYFICCLLAALLYSNIIFAQQNEPLFKHITKANGLISNQVGAILQDSKGFVWIGTQAGLQRYDGKRFTTYLSDVHDANALQSDWISCVFEDSKHRFWIGTDQGAPYLFHQANGKFYNFNLHLQNGAKKIIGIWQFTEDNLGNIWLSAHDGFYKLNNSNNQFEPVNALLNIGSNALPGSITVDKEGNIWFATTEGVKMFSVKRNILFDKNNNPGHLAVFDIKEQVGRIAFDKLGNIWVSTGFDQLLYRFNLKLNKLKGYTFKRLVSKKIYSSKQNEFLGGIFICSNGEVLLPLLSRGLARYNYATDSFYIINAANNISYGLHMELTSYGGAVITEDREKNIWIGTDGGINIFNLEMPHFITYGLAANAAASESFPLEVSDFLQVKDGDVYVSYYFQNGGLSRFDKNLHFKQHYFFKEKQYAGLPVNQLWNLFQDDKGIIWAPNQAGNILQLNPASNKLSILKDTLLSGSINQVQQDKDNNIWVAHYRKGLIKIDAVTKKITRFTNFHPPELTILRRVMCFLPDGNKIWVGTIQNGLQLFNKTTGLFEASFVMDERNKRSISSNNITGIVAYNNDTLIIATQGGINIFDKKTKLFTTVSSKDGLPNNLVQAIVLDDQKNLWAAFAGGFSRINITGLSITNYDENDGIIDNRFNNRFLKLDDGRLMIGASKSFMIFDPAKVTEAKAPPDVTITGFKVFGKWISVDSLVNSSTPVSLSYPDNGFHIEFASLQLNSSNALKYFYQLEGGDKKWIPADDDHSVHYNQLPPGKYIFKVKCANRDGVFCKNITSLAINIRPPFWNTWWFKSLVALLGILLIYAVIKWRERNIKILESEKTKLQQLTAEKYKTQLESEQISSFFSTSLFNKNDVDDVLWDVAKNLIGKLGFVDCMIYLWNDEKTKLVQKAGYGPKGSLEDLTNKHFDVLPGQGVVGAVAQTGESLIIPDTTIDPRYRIDDMARLSEICVPIKYNGQLLGVIDSEHHQKNFFTRQHLRVLTTIATLVASKIKSIEAEQRLRHQKAELANINQQLAEVQLAALRSQMNPHFIFNALNSIKKFVIANEPGNAEKYLGKFSKLIRSILDNSQSGMVTVDKELQLLKLYLELEQLRFGTKLSYTIEVDEKINTGDTQIPSMIVQPFVENAMLHGIMHREDKGVVAIRFLMHEGWLEISIEDNGVGRKKSMEYKSQNAEPHHSIGIEVATKRLQALKKNADAPAGIEIVDLLNDDGEGCGTKVIVSIPVY